MMILSRVLVLFYFILTKVRSEPKIISSTFTTREYVVVVPFDVKSTLGLSTALVTTLFDEPIFTNVSYGLGCSHGKGHVRLKQCTNETSCIDSNEIVSHVRQDEMKIYNGQVTNPQDCKYFIIGASSFGGRVRLSVFAGDYYKSGSDWNSDSLRLCCQDIRDSNQMWNGTFMITISGLTNSTYTLSVSESDIQYASEWFYVTEFSIECLDGFTCSLRESCTINGTCCIPGDFEILRPTSDPLYNFYRYMSNMSFVSSPVKRDTLVVNIVMSVEAPGRNCLLFPFDRLNTCKVSFSNVLGTDLKESQNSMYLLEESPKCDYSSYNQIISEFDKLLATFSPNHVSSFDDVDVLLHQATSYALTDVWDACQKLGMSFLSAEKFVSSRDTNVCTFNPYTEKDDYAVDPCCNTSLQDEYCCTSNWRSVSHFEYEAVQSLLDKSCAHPACMTAYTTNLATIINNKRIANIQQKSCASISQNATRDPRFTNSPFWYCTLRFYPYFCSKDTDCSSYYPSSVCSSSLCLAPCENDSDCIPNATKCKNGLCELFGYRDDDADETLFVQCLESKLDPYLNVFMREEFLQDSRNISYVDKFFGLVIPEVCVGGPTAKLYNSEQVCTQVTACNWAACEINNRSCTKANCLDTVHLNNMTNFCGLCRSDAGCEEYSRPPLCVPLDLPGAETNFSRNSTYCESFGFSWNPLFTEYPCVIPARSFQECNPPELCGDPLSFSYACPASCRLPLLKNSSDCLAFTPLPNWTSFTRTFWYSYTNNGTNYSFCAVSISDYKSCVESGEGVWRHRARWMPGFATTPENCGLCLNNRRQYIGSIDNATICSKYNYCSVDCKNCSTNKSFCELSGVCSGKPGCITPYEQSLVTASCRVYSTPCPNLQWTPLGCLDTSISTSICSLLNGTYFDPTISQYDCLEKMPGLCLKDASVDPNIIYSGEFEDIPEGFSLQNSTMCQMCGGKFVPFYKWIPGQWLSGSWINLTWMERRVVNFSWQSQMSSSVEESYNVLLSQARAKRFSTIVESELACRYGFMTDNLKMLACDCSSSTSSCDKQSLTSITPSVTAIYTVCEGIGNKILSTVASIYVPYSIQFSSQSTCVELVELYVSSTQFESSRSSPLTSAIITSYPIDADVTSVKNDYGVVIGHWIGHGGYAWTFNDTISEPYYLNACITFPISSSYNASTFVSDFPIWGLVQTRDFRNFFIHSETLPSPVDFSNLNQICVKVTGGESVFWFPIGLMAHWNTIHYTDTWPQGTAALLHIGTAMCGIILILAIINLVLLFRNFKDKDSSTSGEGSMRRSSTKRALWFPKLAVLILCFFAAARGIFYQMVFSGILIQYPLLNTVFSELPSLLLLSLCSVICNSWAEIYHYKIRQVSVGIPSTFRTLLVIFNAMLYITFITLCILFYLLPDDTIVSTCISPLSSLRGIISERRIVVYSYHAFFALVSLVLAIGFGFYGFNILKVMRIVTALNAKDKSTIKLLLLSLVCTAALLVTATFQIYSSINVFNSPLVTIVILLLCEFPSSVVILLLYNRTESLSRTPKNKISRFSSGLTTSGRRNSRELSKSQNFQLTNSKQENTQKSKLMIDDSEGDDSNNEDENENDDDVDDSTFNDSHISISGGDSISGVARSSQLPSELQTPML